MKELSQHLKDNIQVESSKEQQKEVQHVLFGKIKPKKGHTLYEINTHTKEITEAKFKTQNVSFTKAAKGDFSELKDLVINENCVYIPALNTQNALKKFEKSATQSDYYQKPPVFDINDITFCQHNI